MLVLFLIITCLSTMVSAQSVIDPQDPLWQKADELAHRFILIDGHVDLPYRM